MEIRLASKDDLEGILLLQPQVHRVEKISENSRMILEELIGEESCDIVVAKEKGKVVGSAFLFHHKSPMYGRTYTILEDMVVDKNQRSKGAGSSLLREIIRLAKNRKSYKLIFTSGFDRERSHSFYEKQGFKKWGIEFRMDLDKDK